MGDAFCVVTAQPRPTWLFTQDSVQQGRAAVTETQAGSQPAAAGQEELPAESQQ